MLNIVMILHGSTNEHRAQPGAIGSHKIIKVIVQHHHLRAIISGALEEFL